MDVHVLGNQLALHDNARDITPSRQQVRQLITLLALHAGHPLSADTLASMLWETDRPARDLKHPAYNARRALPNGYLEAGAGTYQLTLTEADSLDLDHFNDLVEQAQAVRNDDPTTAVTLYRRALDLWGSHPLGDLPATPTTAPLRTRLINELHDAREEYAEMLLIIGEPRILAQTAAPWLVDDPHNEHLRGLIMLALHRLDRKGQAMNLFAEAVNYLDGDAEPGEWLQNLARQIAGNAPELRWHAPAQPTRSEGDLGNAGIDTTVVSPARIYDYLLGGRDNFPVDREAARRIELHAPQLKQVAVDNRAFLGRAVRAAAKAGIRQFLDIGSGLPTADNVHEVARRITPGAHVVYVDSDPTVRAHARALLEDDARTVAFVGGDMRDPEMILAHPDTRRLLDPTQPVTVLMCAVAHFLDQPEALRVVTALLEPWPAGSQLVLSQVTRDGSDPAAIDALVTAAKASTVDLHARSREEILELFGALDLLEPGLTTPGAWRSDRRVTDGALRVLAGVGVK